MGCKWGLGWGIFQVIIQDGRRGIEHVRLCQVAPCPSTNWGLPKRRDIFGGGSGGGAGRLSSISSEWPCQVAPPPSKDKCLPKLRDKFRVGFEGTVVFFQSVCWK